MTFLRVAARGPRARALAPLAVVLALVVACGGDPATPPASFPATPSAAPATALPTVEPPPTEEPSPTDEPGPTEEPTPTEEPEPTPTPRPTPRPTRTPGPAGACTGNAENRAFYAAVAEQVAWDVYCPVLPSGWFVDAGTFRLAGGGRIEIAYRGPGGARLEIRQGAYCGADPGCIPDGPDAGPASFGDRPARLVDLGGGRWLIVAEGDTVDWEVRTSGLDQTMATAVAADFVRVRR